MCTRPGLDPAPPPKHRTATPLRPTTDTEPPALEPRRAYVSDAATTPIGTPPTSTQRQEARRGPPTDGVSTPAASCPDQTIQRSKVQRKYSYPITDSGNSYLESDLQTMGQYSSPSCIWNIQAEWPPCCLHHHAAHVTRTYPTLSYPLSFSSIPTEVQHIAVPTVAPFEKGEPLFYIVGGV